MHTAIVALLRKSPCLRLALYVAGLIFLASCRRARFFIPLQTLQARHLIFCNFVSCFSSGLVLCCPSKGNWLKGVE